MNVVYKGLSKLKNIYNQINPATLTGALDIIVVEQPDGSLLASPFHVRFGKLGVLQTREKVVNISINGEPVAALQMKLGDQGEAFFVIDIDEEEEISPCLITSPLPSRPSTPNQILNDDEDDQEDMDESDKNDNGNSAEALSKQQRKRRKKRKRKSQQSLSSAPASTTTTSKKEQQQIEVAEFRDDTALNSTPCGGGNSRTSSQSSADSFMNMKSDSLRRVLSDSELPENNNKSIVESSCLFEQSGKQHKLEWGWGQLPDENVRDSSGDEDRSTTTTTNNNKDDILMLDPLIPPPHHHHEEVYDSAKHFKSLSLSEESESKCVKDENSTSEVGDKKSATEKGAQARQRNQSEGLYLDDVLSLHPSQADLYLKVKAANVMGGESGVPTSPLPTTGDRPLSPGPPGSDVDSGTDCNESEPSGLGGAVTLDDITDIAISLCGFTGSQQPDEGKFEEKRLDFDEFLANPISVMSHPDLVVRLNSACYPWQQALPMIVSLAVFKRPLTQSFIDRLVDSTSNSSSSNNSSPTTPATQQVPQQQQQQQQSSRTWNWLWRRRGDKDMNKNVSESDSINEGEQQRHETTDNGATEQEVAVIMDPTDLSSSPLEETMSVPLLDNNNKQKQEECDQLHPNNNNSMSTNKNMRKTIRLTSEQLGKLDLKEGANTITFSVTTQFQGTKRCCAHIYKWKWHHRIVVSDIDGTITKSDVFGQILPVVGKDWTQGGIANLYHNISKNGYKFIYLSARAIGQASMTKDYLQWINQHGKTLPPGPLLLSPTSLISAFRREVIEKKPEKFKIECLKDIKALFPIGNPFYAGFGNKTSDVTSYTAVEIADDRMFTINHRGELKQEKLPTYTTTLSDLGDVVDNFFPFVAAIQTSTSSSCTSSTLSSYLNDVCGLQQRHKSYTDFSYWRSDLPLLSDDDLNLVKLAN